MFKLYIYIYIKNKYINKNCYKFCENTFIFITVVDSIPLLETITFS